MQDNPVFDDMDVLDMHQMIQRLEQELSESKASNDALRSNLETAMTENIQLVQEIERIKRGSAKSAKAKRNMTDKGILRRAKILFYHDMKQQPQVVEQIKDDLQKSPIISSMGYIPHTIIKFHTDQMFDKLPKDEQDDYRERVAAAASEVKN